MFHWAEKAGPGPEKVLQKNPRNSQAQAYVGGKINIIWFYSYLATKNKPRKKVGLDSGQHEQPLCSEQPVTFRFAGKTWDTWLNSLNIKVINYLWLNGTIHKSNGSNWTCNRELSLPNSKNIICALNLDVFLSISVSEWDTKSFLLHFRCLLKKAERTSCNL